MHVAVHLDADNKTFHITLGALRLKVCDIQDLQYGEMDFSSYLIWMKREARSIERHYILNWRKVGDVA